MQEEYQVEETEEFLYSLIEYLESDDQQNIAELLKPARVVFHRGADWSYKQWNQKNVVIELKVAIRNKKRIEEHRPTLMKYCSDLYEDTDDFGFTGISFGVLPIGEAAIIQQREKPKSIQVIAEIQTYNNFLHLLSQLQLDDIEARYLREACECAKSRNVLAASTLLGCALEHTLLLFSKAYLRYMENNNFGTGEIEKFRTKVVEAKHAHQRLDELKKRLEPQEKLFNELGLENIAMHFGFFDLIRQSRNETGHPTGIVPTPQDINTRFGQYQMLLPRINKIILELPKITS